MAANKLLVFLICNFATVSLMANGREVSPHLKIAPDILQTVTKEILETYELRPVSTREAMMKRVEVVGVTYRFEEPVSLEEGRCLAIDCARRYWEAFNANEAIRPYLANYPFGPKNVYVSVTFYNSDGTEVYPPYVQTVAVGNGNLIYYYADPEDRMPYQEVVRLPYEQEALKNEAYLAENPDCLEKFRRKPCKGWWSRCFSR